MEDALAIVDCAWVGTGNSHRTRTFLPILKRPKIRRSIPAALRITTGSGGHIRKDKAGQTCSGASVIRRKRFRRAQTVRVDYCNTAVSVLCGAEKSVIIVVFVTGRTPRSERLLARYRVTRKSNVTGCTAGAGGRTTTRG